MSIQESTISTKGKNTSSNSSSSSLKKVSSCSSIISLLSLCFIVFITYFVFDWHHTVTTNALGGKRRHNTHRRRMTTSLTVVEDSLNDDDNEENHDEICREYLLKFLNGTTDEHDECDSFKNAYTAADCKDNKRRNLVSFLRDDNIINQYHNGTTDNDDVVMDDKFEVWKCCDSINEYYDANCQRSEIPSEKLLAIVSVLVLCGLAMSLVRTLKIEWLPDAGACILVGAILGGLVQMFYPSLIEKNLSFDNDLFLHILLPPIIFQAALSINKQAFRRDLFPILCFAVGGTVLSSIAVGILTYFLSSLGGESSTSLPLLDCLLFGSLISSIDPVATLGILTGVGIPQTDTLYTLIFGESLLNDGVAIVLFDTMVKHLGDHDDTNTNLNSNDFQVVDRAMITEIAVAFLICTVASIMIGLCCGALSAIYFWALRSKHTAVVETALFFCFALIPFYIADGLQYSGIISIMVMGFMTDFFVLGGASSDDETQWMAFVEHQNEGQHDDPKRWYDCYQAFSGIGNLSSPSKHHVGFVAEVIASLMEMSIFAYLGLFLFNDASILNLRLNSIGILGCIVSRALMIALFSLLINLFVWLDIERLIFERCFCCSQQQRYNLVDDGDANELNPTLRAYLNRRIQTFLLLAGIRGAVSFALVENIPVYDVVSKTGSQFKAELKAMTSASIVFTVFVFGALTYVLIKKEQNQQQGNNRRMLTQRLVTSSGLDDEQLSSGLLSDLELTIPDPSNSDSSEKEGRTTNNNNLF